MPIRELLGLTNEGKVKIDVVIRKFEKYCTPKKNETYERHLFNTRAQGATKGIDAYVTELRRNFARNCEFGELHDSIIRDRIVCGIRSNEVRKRLLREKDLNLERAVELCKSPEITENQAKNIVVYQDDREVLHHVKDDSKSHPENREEQEESTSKQRNRSTVKDVGQVHQPQKCPAYGQVCHKCKQRNYYSKMCQSKPREFRCDDSDTDELFIGVLGTRPLKQKDWMQSVVINKPQVNMKLDTGAQCNVLPYALCCKLSREKMKKSKTRLVDSCLILATRYQ